MSLRDKIIRHMVKTAMDDDGYLSDANVHNADEYWIEIAGALDVQQLSNDFIRLFVAWADASPATTWAGNNGLKERLLHPELFSERGERL
jgi:hypothetical protein